MDSGSTISDGRPGVANLSGARLPADLGLSSLGLMMQLVGSVSLGVMAYLALMPVFSGGMPGTWYLFLLGSSGAVRAAFHRAAGSTLIYGAPGGAKKALQSYIIVSAIETVIWAFVLIKMGTSLKETLPVIGMLVGWPITLQIMMTRPRYAAILNRDEVTQSEDLGFEGTGVFMLILGVMGALFAGLMLVTMFKLPGKALSSPQGLLVVGVFMMLLARSCIHALAGFKATSGVDTDSASDAAARYYSFGVVSAVISAGAILVLMMMTSLHPLGLVMVGLLLGFLLLWPLLLRRFYTEKNFSVLLAGTEGATQRRAPDAGITALGWILLGSGVFALSSSVPQLLFGADTNPLAAMFGGSFTPNIEQSPWWGIGIASVQLWAGIELTQMSDRFRIAGNIYGLVATGVTLFLVYPMLKELTGSLGMLGGMGSMFKLIGQGTIAINLVVPGGDHHSRQPQDHASGDGRESPASSRVQHERRIVREVPGQLARALLV